jgi:hypothetical protein
VIFLVYSCSKEEIEPIQLKSEQQDLIISANEVAGLKEALHASLRIDQHGGFSVYQASEHTASEFTIDYEHVRQKIDSSGNILFTFGLFDKDNDPKTFMNMILKKDIDHGYQTPYILKFEMTEEFFEEFQFSHSLLNFEGTIKKLAFSQNSQPATFQANIENTRSSTSTVSCPDGNTIEMSNQQRKHDQTTTNELGDNPGSSGTIITTYEICEYFLVTTTWLVNGGTEFAYTYDDTTIEVECTTETISEDFNQLSANTGSDPCDALNDDVGVFYPNNLDFEFKYPLGSSFAHDYPKLTNYLQNSIQSIAEVPKIMNALSTYGCMDKAEIVGALAWNSGPIIDIIDINNEPRYFGKIPSASGLYDKTIPDRIFLDRNLVEEFELSTDPLENESLLFFIGVTILHEFTHYGDNNNGCNFPGEEGTLFEEAAYGRTVQKENAYTFITGG